MAFTCGFFDSQNHDRLYNSLQFGSYFDGIIRDGVYRGYLKEFHVDPAGGLKISVNEGRAFFDHTWNLNIGYYYIDLDPADPSLDRYDVVVLEVNHNKNVRNNTIKVVKGETGPNPSRPVLIKDTNLKQFPLAYIYRHAGIGVIYESDITQAVGTNDCPYASLTDSFASGKAGSVNSIPTKWVTGLFDPSYILNPESTNYYLDIVGLRALINEIKALDFGSGGSGETPVDNTAAKKLLVEEKTERVLLHGFVDGTETISDDGLTYSAVSSEGQTLVRSFNADKTVQISTYNSADGELIAKMTKTFSNEGKNVAYNVEYGILFPNISGESDDVMSSIKKERIDRILLHGFVDGTETKSDDDLVYSATSIDGQTLTRTMNENKTTQVTVYKSADDILIAQMTKTFSNEGKTVSYEVEYEDF